MNYFTFEQILLNLSRRLRVIYKYTVDTTQYILQPHLYRSLSKQTTTNHINQIYFEIINITATSIGILQKIKNLLH